MARQRVLVIDDDPSLLDLLGLVLGASGYDVTLCRSPEEAAGLLAAVPFDLVLTDGFSIAPDDERSPVRDVLRAAGRTPVALVTGRTCTPEEATAAGFAALIPKPFDIDDFDRIVASLLPARRAASHAPG